MNEKLRVVIVDDHDLVREALKRLVDDQEDMRTVGDTANGGDAIALAEAVHPNVMLVDVSMPGMSGMEVTQTIARTCPGVKVIGVTRNRESAFVRAMLNAGAFGYVLKQSASGELIRAIRTVAGGNRYIDRALPPAAP